MNSRRREFSLGLKGVVGFSRAKNIYFSKGKAFKWKA